MIGFVFVLQTLPLWLGAAIAAFVAGFLVRRRTVPGVWSFIALMGALFIWAAAYAISFSTENPRLDLLFSKLTYIGVVFVPVDFLLFCVEYTRSGNALVRNRRWLGLLIVPLITLVLIATNDWHHLMWIDLAATPEGGTPAKAQHFGPWFTVHLVYSYGVVAFGAILLVRTVLRTRHVYRKQAIAILIGLALPLVVNALWLGDLFAWRHFDLTPFVLSISALVIVVAVFRFGLLELFMGLIPVARDAAVDSMADGVIVVDGRGRIADVNPAARRILGRRNVDLVGLDGDEVALGSATLGEVIRVGGGRRTQAVLGEDDEWRQLDMLASPVLGGEGTVVVVRDISEYHHAQQALIESQGRYWALFENATDFVFVLAADGRLLSANRALRDLLGDRRAASEDLHLGDLVAAADRHLIDDWLAGAGTERDDQTLAFSLISADGGIVHLEATTHVVTRADEVVEAQVIARDVTQRHRWEDALRHQALHDGLTDLPNRALLLQRLTRALESASRGSTCHALLLVDLDRFKDVNDTYGHHVGDFVLKHVSARFRALMRSSDTIARLGGDEFAVFMPQAAAAAAREMADRILAVLEAPVAVDQLLLQVRASVGIAFYPRHGTSADDLLRRADVAMYAAKRAGHCARVYALSDDPHSPERLTMVARLRDALAEGRFSLRYHPVVDLANGFLVGAEALARWQDRDFGQVSPARFIPLLDESGMMPAFSLWMVDEAVSQAARWDELGYPLAVSINVSAATLCDRQVLAAV